MLECRQRIVKQNPAKATVRRGAKDTKEPGPQQYEVPVLYCGKGYGKIKRAPAYTFGLAIPVAASKPAAKPNAPIFNIRGYTKKGVDKIPGGIVGEQLESITDRGPRPGPAAYLPDDGVRRKRPPAYSCQAPARPPYQPWDMWTCPPNMYWPTIPFKKAPAYSQGNAPRGKQTPSADPGPGAHDPNFKYTLRTIPAFSFLSPFPPPRPPIVPPPNTYCPNKLLVDKPRAPAPSFGIRHTPYLGEMPSQQKPSKLELSIKKATGTKVSQPKKPTSQLRPNSNWNPLVLEFRQFVLVPA